MKNKILLAGLFCCSLISTEAQVLLDKNAGKNSFPIVSPSANVVVCFDGKDETVVRKSVSLFTDDVRRVTGQDLKAQASNPSEVSARYAIIVGTAGKSVQSPNQKIPDRKTKCVIKTHINIKQNVIFGAKLKPV